MARPVTPAGTTPPRIRSQKSKASLVQAGGRRRSVNLLPDQVRKLDAMVAQAGGKAAKVAAIDIIHQAIDALAEARGIA